ncbi:hypothetical protein OAV92_02680 [Crocinitomicaceae bacterium]|nr:hypothetical protein [Crocinitomicaceae bacterium]
MVEFNVGKEDYGTVLTWETISENDNDYFAIERSYDGKSFEEIASISGAGTSAEHLYYRYTDPTPHNKEWVYYRIRQVDFNGEN